MKLFEWLHELSSFGVSSSVNIPMSTLPIVEKTAFGSSMLATMVVFNDPAYVIIASIGAFVSMGSAHYDLSILRRKRELENKKCYRQMFQELSKAFLMGFLVTLLSFLLLSQTIEHGTVGDITGVKWLDKMLPSFWMILTIAVSTEAVSIWDRVKQRVNKVFK